MPEGDSVHRAARMLDAALTGHVLTKTDFRVPQVATVDLAGRPVDSVCARGKHLLIRIGADPAQLLTMHTHLMMDGRWEVYAPGERWRVAGHKVRCVLTNSTFEAIGVDLGFLRLFPSRLEPQAVGHLGPDPLGRDWDPDEVRERMLQAPERAVGLALLDQRNMAGVGNIYRSEALFVCRVHPLTPVGEVPDLPRLIERCFLMLHANRDRERRKTTPAELREPYWAYKRAGRPCFRCGTPLDLLRIGPAKLQQDRDAYVCRTCQPDPAA
ncbi:Fpg/Nei family DNA glycosylase [Zhihengliuella alba]|uniref:DNA-(apurinic or apyrimidinic site) lyase n=1 Tax=Zhihengliuella alba TaxID=547018 RepID=A0ABP7DX06_9MICC